MESGIPFLEPGHPPGSAPPVGHLSVGHPQVDEFHGSRKNDFDATGAPDALGVRHLYRSSRLSPPQFPFSRPKPTTVSHFAKPDVQTRRQLRAWRLRCARRIGGSAKKRRQFRMTVLHFANIDVQKRRKLRGWSCTLRGSAISNIANCKSPWSGRTQRTLPTAQNADSTSLPHLQDAERRKPQKAHRRTISIYITKCARGPGQSAIRQHVRNQCNLRSFEMRFPCATRLNPTPFYSLGSLSRHTLGKSPAVLLCPRGPQYCNSGLCNVLVEVWNGAVPEQVDGSSDKEMIEIDGGKLIVTRLQKPCGFRV